MPSASGVAAIATRPPPFIVRATSNGAVRRSNVGTQFASKCWPASVSMLKGAVNRRLDSVRPIRSSTCLYPVSKKAWRIQANRPSRLGRGLNAFQTSYQRVPGRGRNPRAGSSASPNSMQRA